MARIFSLVLFGCCLVLSLDAVAGLKLDLSTASEICKRSGNCAMPYPLTQAAVEKLYGAIPNEEIGNPERAINPSDGGLTSGVRNKKKRWTNGVVPYVISSQYTKAERVMIKQAMDRFHARTCIQFRPRKSSDKDYIDIIPGKGCSSASIGRRGGRQAVTLQKRSGKRGQKPGCFKKVGAIMHELMHALGFVYGNNLSSKGVAKINRLYGC